MMRLSLTPLRAALMQTVGALLLLLALSACGNIDYRPAAVGPDTEIVVVTDSARWEGAVGDTLREALAPPITTLPAPEPLFDLRFRALRTNEDLEQVQRRKNVIFAAPLSDSSNAAEVLRSVMADDALQAVTDGGSVVAARSGLWRRDQQVFFIAAATPEDLARTIRSHAEALRDSFTVLTRRRTREEMFDRGRQPEIEARLMEHHGFTVNVQHDYRVAVDTTTSDSTGFVWMRRVLPETRRELFIWYEENADPSTLTPEWIYAARDSLVRTWIRGGVGGFPRIDYRRPLQTDEIDFLGRYGYETRGLWHMVSLMEDGGLRQYGAGGPFLLYTFYDRQQDRLYLIGGMIFAPTYEKREFVRQIEVIAHTFRTRPETTSSETTPPATAEGG